MNPTVAKTRSHVVRTIAPRDIANTSNREMRRLAAKAIELVRRGRADEIPQVIGGLASRFAQRLALSDLPAIRSSVLPKLVRDGVGIANTAITTLFEANMTAKGIKPWSKESLELEHDPHGLYGALMQALVPVLEERDSVPRLSDVFAAAGRAVNALDPRVPRDALPLPKAHRRPSFHGQFEDDCRRAIAMATVTKSPVYFLCEGAPLTAFPTGDARAKDQERRLSSEADGRRSAGKNVRLMTAVEAHAEAFATLRAAEAKRDVAAAPPGPARQYAELELLTRTHGRRSFFDAAMLALKASEIAPFLAEVQKRGRVPADQSGDTRPAAELSRLNVWGIAEWDGPLDQSAVAVWDEQQRRALQSEQSLVARP